MLSLHGQHLIAGRTTASAAATFRGIDAATQEPLQPGFSEATEAEIDEAVREAEAAFATFRHAQGEQRAALLERIATEIESLGDALLQRAAQETGLPLARLSGERGRTCAQLRLFASVAREGSWVDARIDPAQADRKPLPRPDVRRMLHPLGPIAVFGASNFPLAFSVAGGDTASALATGNPVIVKGHPAHPGTSELVGEAIHRAIAAAGLPGGVFSLVHGRLPETGLTLVRHPKLKAVGFTGSRTAGRALFDAAAAREEPIPVFAEMSSLNPVVLLPRALVERGPSLAEGLKNSFTLGVGQFCTKPGLVFGVRSDAWEAFAQSIAAAARTVSAGVMLHAGISRAFQRSLDALRDVEWLARGAASVARVSAADFLRRPELARECFGPFTLLVTAADLAELQDVLRKLEGQLTASIHGTTDDLAGADALLHVLTEKAGRLVINGWPTGVEVGHAMHHGGPYPATTDARFTSVGTAALQRFVRPLCYQDFPDALLPAPLQNANPLRLLRLIDGKPTRDAIG
jgi:2,5-dioxopentanoate dehydrogenase